MLFWWQTITQINADLLSIEPIWTHLSDNWIKHFLLNNEFKMISVKYQQIYSSPILLIRNSM